MGLGHTRPQIFLPTLLPLCVAHLMARSAPLTGQDSPGKDTGLSRKKCRTLQEKIPDSPGRNAGLSRKKCRTLQEEMPDSPGRNAGLSRKRYRTLQEEMPDSPGNMF